MNKQELLKKMNNLVTRYVKHYKTDFTEHDIPFIDKASRDGFLTVEDRKRAATFYSSFDIYCEDGRRVPPSYLYGSHAPIEELFYRGTSGYKGTYQLPHFQFTWVIRESGTHIVFPQDKDYMNAIDANYGDETHKYIIEFYSGKWSMKKVA